MKNQEKYVMRDAELTMLLAQYNKCLVLRIMKIFAQYAEMDYILTCHTDISYWYANIYDKMIESGECTGIIYAKLHFTKATHKWWSPFITCEGIL